MATAIEVVLGLVVILLLIAAAMGIRTIQQFEKGIVFRFGKVRGGIRDPGLTRIVPFGVDRLVKVNMQIMTMGVPGQDGITRDNVSVRVDAVVYFRVIDPVKAVVNVQNYMFAVSQVAQTSLRSVIGRSDLDQLLSDRDRINAELKSIIDEPTEGPWGIRIERVEVKDVALPESMKRSMSRQAEAERERRARVISAEGELQASEKLAEAAYAMSRDPSALQLRLLQTIGDVAAEKNSTLVMPFPVEILRFFERMAPSPERAAGPPPYERRPPEPPESANGQGSAGPDAAVVPDALPSGASALSLADQVPGLAVAPRVPANGPGPAAEG